MRIKKLLTAALCAVLVAASCNMGSISERNIGKKENIVYAAEETQEVPVTEQQRTETAEGRTTKTTESQAAESQTTQGTESQTTQTTESQTTKAAESQTTQTTENQTTKVTENQTTQATESQTTQATENQTTQATESQTTKATESAETGTDGSSQPETPGMENLPSETVPETEVPEVRETELPSAAETEASSELTGTEVSSEVPGTETGEERETEGLTEAVTEAEKNKHPKEETETESESETSFYGSNEELIRHQNIVRPDDIVLEFRYTQVEPDYMIVKNREGISVYESQSAEARVVGKLPYYGIAYRLEDCENGWYYIESGNVRGFVQAAEFATDEVAERIVHVKGLDQLPQAQLLVARTENKAYAHTHTTVHEVIAEKNYAIAEEPVKIYEARRTEARVTGELEEGALCYILADEKRDWVFVESGDARGFVQKDKLRTGKQAEEQVKQYGEEQLPLAKVKIAPEDNQVCYYTLTSVKEASKAAKLREDIVHFALDYLGNPYVWGGTSLVNGADCSGFVQSVYAQFGYSLPRVAEAQAVYGMQIPVDAAVPGDLIFYARNGYVYHVSMYIGNGQVVHAAGRKLGIITSGITGNAVWATRIITD